ncbi:activator-dependent family glycosyltransferase [Streptomyces umbrinus]
MRVLFVTPAVNSHLNNLVPIAWALRTAGHEVCVAGQPDITEAIKNSGLTAVAVGERMALPREIPDGPDTPDRPGAPQEPSTPFGLGYDIAETRPDRLTLDYVRGTLAGYTSVVCEFMADRTMLDDLVKFARAWKPDLVVWDAHTYTGPVLARAVGAAHIRVLPAPDHWARMRALHRELVAGDPTAGTAAADPLADYLAGKLEPWGGEFGDDMVTGQATVDPLPSWLGVPLDVDRISVRHVPYNGPTVIPAWLRKEPKRPRVCLTLGQTRRSLGVHGRGGEDVSVATMLQEVAALDVEVIATLSADQLPKGTRIPDNVRLFDFIPLNALLPSCSAIVHYGGMGAVAAAVVHGVPQLGIPGNIWGEAGVMRQLEAQGAGLRADAGTLVDGLTRLLDDPGFRQGAAQIQKDMLSRPSPRDIVPEIEAVVLEHQKSRGQAA